MIFYRIRHKKSGLFYQPTRGRYSSKTNLGPNGKVYAKKPSFEHICSPLDVTDRQHEKFGIGELKTRSEWCSKYFMKFVRDDWEIVEYELVEKT